MFKSPDEVADGRTGCQSIEANDDPKTIVEKTGEPFRPDSIALLAISEDMNLVKKKCSSAANITEGVLVTRGATLSSRRGLKISLEAIVDGCSLESITSASSTEGGGRTKLRNRWKYKN